MTFAQTISNEQVAALPAIQYNGQIVVVETPQALAEACEHLSKQRIIGFDTETRPSFTAGVTNKVALLQLYGGGKCFLIRLNRVQMSKPLTAILHNPNILKIGAAVRNDILGLAKLRHFTAGGFIDLQEIVGNYG
ncbi:MAG: 3'-5' exonuclease domain-containing protein 2, partial [Alistipes sp.]|nr:3'-5' exonuclease domain-containing protein 2 [Alistipes sp.]